MNDTESRFQISLGDLLFLVILLAATVLLYLPAFRGDGLRGMIAATVTVVLATCIVWGREWPSVGPK